jgi:hypothetical protein
MASSAKVCLEMKDTEAAICQSPKRAQSIIIYAILASTVFHLYDLTTAKRGDPSARVCLGDS